MACGVIGPMEGADVGQEARFVTVSIQSRITDTNSTAIGYEKVASLGWVAGRQ